MQSVYATLTFSIAVKITKAELKWSSGEYMAQPNCNRYYYS